MEVRNKITQPNQPQDKIHQLVNDAVYVKNRFKSVKLDKIMTILCQFYCNIL